ncbi:MAG: glycosyltransferase family 4 protein [Planctomycetes bacterium]|nr:glycosyltransferase family 4 protein [Planctomycetota bacterium]MCB9904175.1 glycosyltransferase family 4 protein [Planctomycetota bacterium]
MKLMMFSGDRQVCVGEKGPFHSMLRSFSTHFERIDVLVPPQPGPIVTTTLFDKVHFHPADCSRFAMPRYLFRKGRELIREHGHELIISHDYGLFYNGRGAAKLSRATGVPYLSEIHHVPGVPVAADRREVFERWITRRYVHWAVSRAAAFRVVNATEMPELLRSWGVPAEKIEVIPSLYIDLDVFRPVPGQLEFQQDMVFVGRLVANKGLDRMVAALALLRKSGQRVHALFVGKGPLAGELRQRVRQAGLEDTTRFIEWVDTPDDLADIYRRSRVVVCASTCEGGPRFTVEAMACGTPAVSTPVGVMTELLQDGEAGRLCGFHAEGLAAALLDVLGDEDRRRRMGRAAWERAQPHEYERAIANYADGVKRIAAAHADPGARA